jgi:two-component system, OmpR family, sensor histidine kinase KdpD
MMQPETREMRRELEIQPPVRWIGATLVQCFAAFLLVLAGVDEAAAGLVLLTLVVWLSTLGGVAFSLYVAFVSSLFFDYFFISPVRTLQLAGPQEWAGMFCFLASCVVVGRLADRARRQTLQAEQRREDVERLYELSQQMMLHDDAAGLVHELPKLIVSVFALEGAAVYVSDLDQFHASGIELPMGAEGTLRAMTVSPLAAMDVSVDFAAMPLALGMRTIGAMGWRPAARLSREVATAVGAQVAIAMTRSIAVETSARLEAAREGERLRTALIDSLTHELRTPLTSIRAAATTLLQDEGLDEAGRKDLAALVDEEASRLDALIGEAVEMAEIDAQVLRVELVRQNPSTLLEEAVEESREALKGHRVEVTIEADGEPAWFDPLLLRRVLRHLLENAGRYTPAGSRIRLSSRRAGNRLEFLVEDNGPGIDALDLPLIFEKFYRGKKGAAMGKGSGMGLAIVRAILAAHEGGIEAASAPGQGTSFRFWVPLVEKEPEKQG